MAKKGILYALLLVVLVFGILVVGCDNGTTYENIDNLSGHIKLDNYYPIVDETITATWVTYQIDPIGTPKWEWFRDGTPIGGNSSTYTVVPADIGKIIKVKVSFSGNNGSRDDSVKAVLNTPATATVAISIVASRSGSFYSVDVTLTLSDGRWNPTINRFDIFDLLVTLSGTPDISGWTRSGNATFGIGPSFNVEYLKSLDSVPSIDLTAILNSSKLAEIRSFTNVYNSLTVGNPSSVSVSQWDFR